MNGGEVYLGVVISGFVGVLLININISVVFCWSLVGSYCIRFNLWWGALATGSSLGSLVSSLVSSSLLGFSGSGCRYSFTIVVLKLVGPLGSCTLHISLLILSNLSGPVHLLLYLV